MTFIWLNGLWSPLGIEAIMSMTFKNSSYAAKWPVEPVGD